ncbi:unnamed protein product [Brachionus calyciflorus]|uniref:Uncharacterized protein n=1 Tax=Brachionus calyciflorus TaxID=104777 RepID=A0A814QTU8_9BILA|nr:unnamed protein product [Brachionus calyciflorus]
MTTLPKQTGTKRPRGNLDANPAAKKSKEYEEMNETSFSYDSESTDEDEDDSDQQKKTRRKYVKKNDKTSTDDKTKSHSIKEQKKKLEEAEKAEIITSIRNEGNLYEENEIEAEVNRRLRIKNMERKQHIPLYIITKKNNTYNDIKNLECKLSAAPNEELVDKRPQNHINGKMKTANHIYRSEMTQEDREKINHELESKYNRNRYSVMIHGNNIETYSTNIFDRLDELKRCVGVSNPLMILPVVDKDTEVTSLKIVVDNYHDFLKLTGKWPNNAFTSGVSIESLPPNLSVVITSVEKDITISNEDKRIKHIEQVYGLSNVERIFTADKKPTMKLRARVKTVLSYIEVLKHGIYLDITSKRHQVTPNIIYSKVCKQCGNLNHREREWKSKTLCLKCGQDPHPSYDCMAKCIKCHGLHQCSSELCSKLVEKTLNNNKYTIDIYQYFSS